MRILSDLYVRNRTITLLGPKMPYPSSAGEFLKCVQFIVNDNL